MSYKNAATAEELEAVIGGDVPVAEAEHAASADSAAQAAKVGDANVGSSTRPVYLDAGTPKQCGSTLNVSISGNAATATNAQSAANAANAANAENAAHAASADTATNAQKAAEADHAASADTAQTAQTAASATTAGTADKATQDGDGNIISSTYIKKSEAENVKTHVYHTHQVLSKVSNAANTLQTNVLSPATSSVKKGDIIIDSFMSVAEVDEDSDGDTFLATTIQGGNFIQDTPSGIVMAIYAQRALQDGAGNVISDTYAVKPVYGTVSIATSRWSSKQCVLTSADGAVIQAIKTTSYIQVSLADASAAVGIKADVKATAQGNGTLTFTCSSVPTAAVTVAVAVFN